MRPEPPTEGTLADFRRMLRCRLGIPEGQDEEIDRCINAAARASWSAQRHLLPSHARSEVKAYPGQGWAEYPDYAHPDGILSIGLVRVDGPPVLIACRRKGTGRKDIPAGLPTSWWPEPHRIRLDPVPEFCFSLSVEHQCCSSMARPSNRFIGDGTALLLMAEATYCEMHDRPVEAARLSENAVNRIRAVCAWHAKTRAHMPGIL